MNVRTFRRFLTSQLHLLLSHTIFSTQTDILPDCPRLDASQFAMASLLLNLNLPLERKRSLEIFHKRILSSYSRYATIPRLRSSSGSAQGQYHTTYILDSRW
jgi:hypothetical protein